MCGKDTQMSHFLSAFSSGTYSISLRGLAMLNGGSQTWTLKGYQDFSSDSVAVVDIARNATPPSKAKPSVVADCFMPLSLFMAAPGGTPRCRRCYSSLKPRPPLAARQPGDCCASAAHCKFR